MENIDYVIHIKVFKSNVDESVRSDVLFCSESGFNLFFDFLEMLKMELGENKTGYYKTEFENYIRIVRNEFGPDCPSDIEKAIKNKISELKNQIYPYTKSPIEIKKGFSLIRSKRIELWEKILKNFRENRGKFEDYFKNL